MFHRMKKVRKIIMKRVLKNFLEKGVGNIVLFENFTEHKLFISK